MKKLIEILFIILLTTTLSAQKPTIEWVNIPNGTFTMGSPKKEVGKRKNDEIQHKVTLSAFKMSKYEVTVGQFKAFVDATGYVTDADKGTGGKTGSFIMDGIGMKISSGANWLCNEKGIPRPETEYNFPVLHVTLNDANAFAAWFGCRLPTEAEWEYACRAGTTTPFNTGNNITTSQANYDGNSPYMKNEYGENRMKAMPVGSFNPNEWGLHDMHGNAEEICSDWYADYPTSPQINPQGPKVGASVVMRGGSWISGANEIRSAQRRYMEPIMRSSFIGFRLALSE